MRSDSEPNSVWQCLRSRDPHLGIRVGTSVFAGVTLTGFGMLAAWAWALSIGRRYVRDEEMAVALLITSCVWLKTLFWIWGRVRRAKTLVGPILLTLGIGIATLLGGVVIAEFVHRDEEIVITAVLLIASGIVILVWMPAIQRLRRGKPVIGADNQVDVHCPSCGYSLVGLRDLRCPECGERFTIDELIRAQEYARPKVPDDTLKLPESGPPSQDSKQRADV